MLDVAVFLIPVHLQGKTGSSKNVPVGAVNTVNLIKILTLQCLSFAKVCAGHSATAETGLFSQGSTRCVIDLPAEVAAFSMKHHFTVERITDGPTVYPDLDFG